MPSRICRGPADGDPPCPTRALVPVRRGSKTAARCGPCRTAWQQAKDGRRPMRRTYAEQQRRAQQVQAQPWCSDCGATTDLTAEHINPVATSGDEHGELVTLCRPCNSKRGARLARR
jgi:5-methylcytosine-specific restriction endonuclease McrA